MSIKPSSLIFLVTIFLSNDVGAFCSEPSMYAMAPSAPGSFSRPSPPFCLGSYQMSGQHSCSEWEISNFIDEINAYIQELNDYAREAQRFAADAAAFADDAIDYAQCEAASAKEPIG